MKLKWLRWVVKRKESEVTTDIMEYPKCSSHMDCFANKNGSCTCLSDNYFGKHDCPFYKKKSIREKESNRKFRNRAMSTSTSGTA